VGKVDITIATKDYEKQEREWDGVKRTSYAQWAQLQQGGFVLSFLVSHNNEADVLPPGRYELDPTSFSTKNGRLSVERVRLRARSGAPKPA
jgi:hypothetical protein